MLAKNILGKSRQMCVFGLLLESLRGTRITFGKSAFPSISTLSELPMKTLSPSLFRNLMGYDSELAASPQSVPYMEEFRELFMRGSGFLPGYKPNCQFTQITFISRQDYDKRTKDRKITNEDELISAISKNISVHWRASLDKVRPETMTFQEQLDIISSRGILIGANGAGLTHAQSPTRPPSWNVFPLILTWQMNSLRELISGEILRINAGTTLIRKPL